ncbi:MAG TPA: DciA family protein [Gammaproteobacteria bacterium]|jgi:hypothetical protein|nr:DciA family protein [Gammaproteobacteria bacterium]
MKSSPIINTLLLKSTNRDLLYILSKVKELISLNQQVAVYLDPAFRPYCQVANSSAGKLTLLTANGSIATQLRFQTNELLAYFKQDPKLCHIKEIHFIVRPITTNMGTRTVTTSSGRGKSEQKKSGMQPLSRRTADTVRQIAQSIVDDELRKVMEKIAGNVE